jgi:hypothetical protein
MRPTICSLLEPHYKQNPYANPKRTAKSSKSPALHPLLLDDWLKRFVQNTFDFQRFFSSPCEGLQLEVLATTET